MNSLIERFEFLARTSEDPTDAQGFRDAVEAFKMCQRALEFYSCKCGLPCTEQQYKDALCGMRANRTLKAMADGRTNH